MGEATSTFQQLIELSQRLPLKSQAFLVEKLRHYSSYSDRLIVIEATSGSGASSVLTFLAQSIEEPSMVLMTDALELNWVQEAFQSINIDAQNLTEALDQIGDGQDIFLFVDNAYQLDEDSLNLLAQRAQQESFHCILVISDKEYKAWQWVEENQEKLILQNIPALPLTESHALLARKMQISEEHLDAIIDAKQLGQVLEQSAGNPKAIVMAAEKIAANLNRENSVEQVVEPKFPLIKYASYGALALVLMLIIVFQDSINQSIDPSEPQPIELFPDEVSKQAETEPLQQASIESETQQQSATEVEDNKEVIQETAKTLAEKEVTKAETARVETTQAEIAQENNNHDNTRPSLETLMVAELEQEIATIQQPPVEQRQKSPRRVPPREQLAQSTTAQQKPLTYLSAVEKELLELPGDYYVVQLAGFTHMDNLIKFMENNKNVGHLNFYRTIRQQKEWIVAFSGPYQSKLKAQQIRNKMPKSVQKYQPWLKSISAIKNEIKRLNSH